MADYLLENAWEQQRQRLAGLEAWFDPGTKRHIEGLGERNGWHCLEVGAGGGSIAAWLCQQVGPHGHVVATDLDTRFLEALDVPNLDVRRHNILTDDLPARVFDLVHARFLVEHLADRRTALCQMVRTLKPGGWLLIEETDSSSWVPDPTMDAESVILFYKWTAAHIQLCQLTGANANAGRRLYGEFHALGLVEVGAEGRVFMVRGGSPHAQVWFLTAEQVRDRVVETRLLTAKEMEQLLALLMNPEFIWMEGLVMAAWGRRPALFLF